MFKPKFIHSIIVAAALAPALALAAGPEVYVSVPFNAFDNEITYGTGHPKTSTLSDAVGFELSAGYQFDNPFALELSYSRASTDVQGINGLDATYQSLTANALVNLIEGEKAVPYFLVGVGNTRITTDSSYGNINDSSLDLGLGVKAHVTDLFVVRAELRNSHTIREGFNNGSLSVGFGLNFGDAPAPHVVAAPAPKPVAADVDSDHDGVLDGADKCPGTAPKVKVDADGCPVVLSEAVSISVNVLFDTASDVVKPEFDAEVKKVADFLEQYQGTSVVIEGHTDTRGSNASNKTLSQKRADSVAKVLVSKFGIASSRVKAIGFGEEQPLVANDKTPADQAKNRRVIAKVSAEKQTQVTK